MTETSTLPNIEGVLELATTRRSIRGFAKGEDAPEVPEEYIEKMLEVARWAPSGGNGQPWEFIVIRDPDTREKIVEIFLKQLEHKREMELARRGKASVGSVGFRDAPVLILMLGDPRVQASYPVRTILEKSASHFYSGMANASMLLMLAASSLGLATHWVSDASSPYMSVMLKVLLDIPEPLKVYHLFPVGWPAKITEPRPRRAVQEFTHYERYDMAKYRTDQDLQEFFAAAGQAGPLDVKLRGGPESGHDVPVPLSAITYMHS